MSVFLTGLLAIFLGPYLSLVLPGIGENAGVPRSPLLCLSRAWNKGKKERGAATGRGSVHSPNGESTSLHGARSSLVALLFLRLSGGGEKTTSPCHRRRGTSSAVFRKGWGSPSLWSEGGCVPCTWVSFHTLRKITGYPLVQHRVGRFVTQVTSPVA